MGITQKNKETHGKDAIERLIIKMKDHPLIEKSAKEEIELWRSLDDAVPDQKE